MNKLRQGLSRRGYAVHAGISHVYVCKLIERGKIPVLGDGSLDPVACDNARASNTVQGRGQRRLQPGRADHPNLQSFVPRSVRSTQGPG